MRDRREIDRLTPSRPGTRRTHLPDCHISVSPLVRSFRTTPRRSIHSLPSIWGPWAPTKAAGCKSTHGTRHLKSGSRLIRSFSALLSMTCRLQVSDVGIQIQAAVRPFCQCLSVPGADWDHGPQTDEKLKPCHDSRDVREWVLNTRRRTARMDSLFCRLATNSNKTAQHNSTTATATLRGQKERGSVQL